ncbi:MAG: hypothetical protein RPU39_01110 [Candidatus Sedimenticola sp. (ex Thyasira tokunagai)]
MDDALQANKDFQDGTIGVARLAEIRKSIDKKIQVAGGEVPRDTEIIGVVRGLVDVSAQDGWSHAVSSYLGDLEDEPKLRRFAEISDLIKARL